MNAHPPIEIQSPRGVLSLEEAIQQIINLGQHDPLTVTREIEERYEIEWLKEELYALREEFISYLARQRINNRRRSAMTALRKGKPGDLMLAGEWVPNWGWKRLADWTAADLRSRENYYRKIAGSALLLADWCRQCIEIMETEKAKTLGKVKTPLPALEEVEKDILENGKLVEE
jgi:hypothetical protein